MKEHRLAMFEDGRIRIFGCKRDGRRAWGKLRNELYNFDF
jgi:hypothetical protein